MILLNEMLSQGVISFLNITNANIVCDGNSLTAGGYSTSPYPTQLLSAVNSIVSGATVVNKGVNGQQTTQMNADAITDIDALISNSRPNILCVWEVSNDIYYNGSYTTAISNMTTYCQARKAAGWKIILMGIIDRNQTTQGGLTPTQYRAQITLANTEMRNNFLTIGANVFVDLISDSRLQNAADATYYVNDQVHLTSAGNTVVVQLIMQKIVQIAASVPPAVPMIVFSGESNSGGYALNSQATTAELATRPQTIILNNNTLLFESLQIGVNNYIKHAGMNYPLATDIHGWELGLSNIAAAGTLGATPLRIVKTGQGGSVISQWAVGASFNSVLIPWDAFQQRVDAALANTTVGAIPFALFYSQGINDAIAGTTTTDWQNATIAHFAKIRAKYGQNIPIIMTKFMSSVISYTAYNTAIASICASVQKCYFVDTEDISRRDSNHWDYAGMKILSARMLDKLNANI